MNMHSDFDPSKLTGWTADIEQRAGQAAGFHPNTLEELYAACALGSGEPVETSGASFEAPEDDVIFIDFYQRGGERVLGSGALADIIEVDFTSKTRLN